LAVGLLCTASFNLDSFSHNLVT